jgi:hypothetical protein
MTYLEEIDEMMKSEKSSTLASSTQFSKDAPSLEHQTSIMAEINKKMAKLEVESEIFRVVFDKNLNVHTLHLQKEL